MARIQYFIDTHPDLFRYQKAEEIHLHDKFLDWMILRYLPDDITPNRITLFRFVCTPIVFFLIIANWYQLGIITFLLLAFTDALDGSLARTKNKITNFGKVFDPLADKFLIGSMVVILVFQYLDQYLAAAIVMVEIGIILVVSIGGGKKFKTSKG